MRIAMAMMMRSTRFMGSWPGIRQAVQGEAGLAVDVGTSARPAPRRLERR